MLGVTDVDDIEELKRMAKDRNLYVGLEGPDGSILPESGVWEAGEGGASGLNAI